VGILSAQSSLDKGDDEEQYADANPFREPGMLKTGRGRAAEMTSEPKMQKALFEKTKAE